jgi:hydrogenase maturation protein HypF
MPLRPTPTVARLKVSIRGAVQGVGFRPFVFRLATELGLNGWVNNLSQGVFIEIEGARSELEAFLLRLENEKPPRSFIQSLEASWLDAIGYTAFEIKPSEAGGAKTTLVLPDIATCPDCLREVFDPSDRRYGYPFTNCTNCGPRFSIIEALPYDRANTSMRRFTMCARCQAEYDDPRDRRFHAQPNACPICGPHLELWDRQSKVRDRDSHADPIAAAAEAIRAGQIVAVKGLGGFHLVVAAHDEPAVRRLRELKHREEKPFALMFPSLDSVKLACEVSPLEERLLRSPEAPIVLLRRFKAQNAPLLAASVAPANPYLGILLPYTSLHHLLLSALGFPVVATSGNLSDEPICTDQHEALTRLGSIADLFLIHNRPIVRHVDDSIARIMAGRELVLRRARGYAPLPIQFRPPASGTQYPVSSIQVGARGQRSEARGQRSEVRGQRSEVRKHVAAIHHPPSPIPSSVLAVGAHLKNTIALSVGPQVFISQHIGDLETAQAHEAFRRVIGDFERLYETNPVTLAADAHPDYLSTQFARQVAVAYPLDSTSPIKSSNLSPAAAPRPSNPAPQLISVQHHLAHVLSCMAENELEPPVLGVSWDGTGYGLDGTVWGGEFFLITETKYERVAHLRQFRLPGGDKAVKEPRRTALGLLYELFGQEAFRMSDLAPIQSFSPRELAALKAMLQRQLNSPGTSSIGRLFDAVASLAGIRQQMHFEGQAAMELEFALEGNQTDEAYSCSLGPPTVAISSSGPTDANQPSEFTFHISRFTPQVLDWSAMLTEVLADIQRKATPGEISAKFHNMLAESIVAVARRVGQERVVLSGGCFQNRYLTERAIGRLRSESFRPYWHQRVPPNDGGVALGQVVAAWRGLLLV